MEPKKRCPYCAEEILAAATKCKHCGSMLLVSAKGQPALSVPAAAPLRKSIWTRPAHQTWIFWLAAIVFLAIKFSGFLGSPKSDSPAENTATTEATSNAPVPKAPELTAVIETNGFVITIKNNDDFPWQGCDAIINGGFSGYDFEFGDLGANQARTLSTTQFSSGSKRFNPSTTVVENIVISCKTRNGDQTAMAWYK